MGCLYSGNYFMVLLRAHVELRDSNHSAQRTEQQPFTKGITHKGLVHPYSLLTYLYLDPPIIHNASTNLSYYNHPRECAGSNTIRGKDYQSTALEGSLATRANYWCGQNLRFC
jgi:hypothetical protein